MLNMDLINPTDTAYYCLRSILLFLLLLYTQIYRFNVICGMRNLIKDIRDNSYSTEALKNYVLHCSSELIIMDTPVLTRTRFVDKLEI